MNFLYLDFKLYARAVLVSIIGTGGGGLWGGDPKGPKGAFKAQL